MKKFVILFGSIAFVSLVGCGGQTADVGSSAAQGQTGLSAGAADAGDTGDAAPPAVPVTTTPSATPPFSPGEVALAEARCAAPHGPAYAPTTLGPFRDRLLATSWYACDGTGTAWTKNGVGVRLAKESADGFQGHFWALGLDAAGDLVQLQGLDSEGSYSFEAATASTVTTWDDNTEFSQVWISPGSVVVEFEDAPLRMRTNGNQWYVGIGIGAD